MPRFGFVEQIARGRIVGWAVDTDCLDQAARVTIRVNGAVRGHLLADGPRHDAPLLDLVQSHVAEAMLPKGTGRFGFEYPLDPPLSPFREHDVSVRFVIGDSDLVGGRHTLGCPAPGHMALTPVLVTVLSRSGTTVLMRYLAQHPAIVVADQYP